MPGFADMWPRHTPMREMAMNKNTTTGDVVQGVLDSDVDIVIRAGAGTGKTYTLVKKFVHELCRKRDDAFVSIDNLAAITFTEKAAEEMKERIRDELTGKIDELKIEVALRADDGNTDNAPISSANLIDDKKTWNERQKLFAHLIRQRQRLAGAYITTIHSFCARILKERPVAAKVDPSYKVMDQETATELLEKCARDVVLRNLANGDEGAFNLVLALGFQSVGGGILSEITRVIPLLRAANTTAAILENKLDEYMGKLPAYVVEAKNDLKDITPKLLALKNKSSVKTLGQEIEEAPDRFYNPGLTFEDARYIHNKAKWVDRKVEEGKEYTFLSSETANILYRIATPAIEAKTAIDTRAFLSIIHETAQEYNAAKTVRSELDFDDLQERALNLLEDNPKILDEYRKNIARLMVDEFQDINELQKNIVTLLAPPGQNRLLIVGDVKQSIYGFRGADFSVFESLANEIETSGGDSFTLAVSRRATPDLIDFSNRFFESMMKKNNEYSTPFNAERDSLTPHRTGEGITSAVYRVCTKIGGSNQAEQRLAEATDLARMIRVMVASGDYRVEGADGKPRPLRYGDVALLLRSFSNINLYEAALRFAGVNYTVIKGRGFFGVMEIRDITNLLSCLEYLDDSLALMATLRSPFVGLSDSSLYALCRLDTGAWRDPASIVTDVNKIPSHLDEAEQTKLRFFIRRFAKWRELKERLTIASLLEMILDESGYLAVMTSRLHGEQKLANILKLIELARQYESDGRRGLLNFVSFLKHASETNVKENQADISGGDDDMVTIMTVHQAKGLEFPAVIVGDLGAQKSSMKNAVAYAPHTRLALKYFEAFSGLWIVSMGTKEIIEAMKDADESEDRRLLYVAMTRARDLLFLSGAAKKGRKGLWQKWIDDTIESSDLNVSVISAALMEDTKEKGKTGTPAIVDKVRKGFRPEKSGKEGIKQKTEASRDMVSIQMSVTALASFIHCRRYYYYQRMMAPSSRKDEDKKGASSLPAMSLGSRVHAMLEQAPFNDATWPAMVEGWIEERFADCMPKERVDIATGIARAFELKPLSGVKDAQPHSIMQEAPLVIKIVDNNLRVTLTGAADLAWQEDDGHKIVDYKYSKRPEDERRYLMQVKLYAYAWMVAQKCDATTAAVVYLAEENKPVSSMNILKSDIAEIRKRIVSAAKNLKDLDGQPETDWPLALNGECKDYRCAYRFACFPDEKA